MNQLRALIADSDGQAREHLRNLLGWRADLQIVGECENGFQAATAIERLQPDVVFLDVHLLGMDGFAVCDHVGDTRPHIVFTSSTAEGAVGAFERSALDYLLKPFADHRLLASVERVREAMAERNAGVPAEELRALLREIRNGRPEHLAVRSQRATVLLPVAEIDWVEAQKTTVRIYASRKSHVFRSSLTDIERRLPGDRFIRVHREAIVNLARVQELLPWMHGDIRMVLYDGTMVPVGRHYRKNLETRLSIEARPPKSERAAVGLA
jgi:two-component system LytT family response regulator